MLMFALIRSVVRPAIACALLVSMGFVWAQGATAPATRLPELKIGLVNTEKLLRESAPAQRAFKKLEREFAARQADVERIAKKFRDLSVAFEKEQLTLNDVDRRNKQRELEVMNRDLQRAQRELREDENLRRNEELAGLQERLQKTIQQIAESEKFDLILQEAVYASNRIDITDRVLKALADK
jgi:outer membrane protein